MQIYKMEKNSSFHNDELRRLKKVWKELKKEIDVKVKKSINNYWKNRVSKISKQDFKSMFPEISRIFRNRKQLKIPPLKIPVNNKELVELADLNENNLIRDNDNDNNFVIYESKIKRFRSTLH